MRLIIGGRHQGKLDYALSLGYTMADVATSPPTDKPILYGLQNLTRTNPDLTEADIPDCIVICDELGCGVVPLDPEERAWRERTGRLCCQLAKRASQVDRVFCGIATALKEDTPCTSG